MKRVFSRSSVGVLAALSLVFLVACGDDETTSPNPANTGSISGTVTFTGTWPASGDVQVAVYSSLPPAGPPDAYTNPLNGATDYPTYTYTISGLDPGTYDGVIVTWRDPSNVMSSTLIGQYSGGMPVVIEKGKTATGFDITADLTQVP